MGFDLTIPYLSVFFASLVAFIIGFLWYSPLLFGKIWMKEMKMTKKSIEKAKKEGNMPLALVVNFIATVIMISMLACLISLTGFTTLYWQLKLAAMVWLGFIATQMLNSVLWEGRSITLYLINIGHSLVALLAAVVVFAIV